MNLTELSQSKLWESDSSESEPVLRKAKVKGDLRDIGWSSIIEILCGFEEVPEHNKEIHFGDRKSTRLNSSH